MEVVCSALPLAVVLHPACLLDSVCSVVAAGKASLTGGFSWHGGRRHRVFPFAVWGPGVCTHSEAVRLRHGLLVVPT